MVKVNAKIVYHHWTCTILYKNNNILENDISKWLYISLFSVNGWKNSIVSIIKNADNDTNGNVFRKYIDIILYLENLWNSLFFSTEIDIVVSFIE